MGTTEFPIDSAMRIPNIALPAAVILAVLGAFAAGRFVGAHDAQKLGAIAAFNSDASRSAEAFMIASSARDALKSEPAKADAILARYAALQVSALTECSVAPSCAASVGKLMPPPSRLEAAVSTARAADASQ